jgi:hypothetical protein
VARAGTLHGTLFAAIKTQMRQLIARGIGAVLPPHVIEALTVLQGGAVPWDEAAVQLEQLRSEVHSIGYPQYLYGLLCAARTARAIGANGFTAIEFGVAGGNGLIALEKHAIIVERLWTLSVAVVGFDTSTGLPQPRDPRDCPFAFRGSEFTMDEGKLRARLGRAQLRLGDVTDTVPSFMKDSFPPIGFVSHDLDLYTSTRDSFALLKSEPQHLLPRVTMYFDDLLGYPYTTVTGEWAAINEFNASQTARQIGQIFGLRQCLGHMYRFANWCELIFMLHVFDHPAYNAPEMTRMRSESLRL